MLALLIALLAPAPTPAPATVPAPALRAASLECQRDRMRARPDRTLRADDACVCNAKVGLPEYPACRVARR